MNEDVKILDGSFAPVQSRDFLFRGRPLNRYCWHNRAATGYVPPIFAALTEHEWDMIDACFTETDIEFAGPGEVSVPGTSFLAGLIAGSGISAMVQCRHYFGFSTLLLGLCFRAMSKKMALFSIDIDPEATDYTKRLAEFRPAER
jgi:predicted O-methyltransferase YrrM